MIRQAKVIEYLEKPLVTYIKEELCARRGRLRSYFDTINRIGVPLSDIERSKKYREEPHVQLTRDEIEKFVIGKTLRRPCFDVLFRQDGVAKASWIDGLDDTDSEIEVNVRKRLNLTFKPDESYAVPVYQTGRWYWGEAGNALFREFSRSTSTALKTEFFFQSNGLLSMKSHNPNQTIWYDLLVFNSDQVLDNFGVNWSEIEGCTDIASNNQRERQANEHPQHKTDHRKFG